MGNDIQRTAQAETAATAVSRLDRFIAAVFPAWACRRAAARLHFEQFNHRRALASIYGAAERNRLSADWTTRNTSADGAIVADLTTLNARARAAVRDDWAMAAVVSGWRRHVVGTGITFKASARDRNGQPLTAFNKTADALYRRWCRPEFCDLERKRSDRGFQSMLQSEKVQVGEGFVILQFTPRRGPEAERRRAARVPNLTLQAFEPEMLDDIILANPDNGNEVRHGIEIDKFGAAVAYWVYVEGHPLDSSWLRAGTPHSTRIPAEFVCHVAHWDRPRQTHGVSRLAPVLKKGRHLQMYDEYQMVAARMEACYGAAIQSPAGAGPVWGTAPAGGESTANANGNRQMDFEPGMMLQMLPGETVEWHDPKRPGELYDPFVKAQVNQIATGAGLDYVTVVRDFTGGTYSGQRQGMIERDYETDPEQAELIDHFCRPVRDLAILIAIADGLLAAPGHEDPEQMERYLEADARAQAKPWVDPNNQASATETALRNKVTTRRAVLNELNEDWREVFQQLADEDAELKRLGLSTASDQQSAISNQPAAPTNGQAPEKPAAEPATAPAPDQTEGGPP